MYKIVYTKALELPLECVVYDPYSGGSVTCIADGLTMRASGYIVRFRRPDGRAFYHNLSTGDVSYGSPAGIGYRGRFSRIESCED